MPSSPGSGHLETSGKPLTTRNGQSRGTGDKGQDSTALGSSDPKPLCTPSNTAPHVSHTKMQPLHPSNETLKVFNTRKPDRNIPSLFRYKTGSIDRAPSKSRTASQQAPANTDDTPTPRTDNQKSSTTWGANSLTHSHEVSFSRRLDCRASEIAMKYRSYMNETPTTRTDKLKARRHWTQTNALIPMKSASVVETGRSQNTN